MKEFRLVPGPTWTEEPSLKLEMRDRVSDDGRLESTSSLVFPERMLDELLDVLRHGPEGPPPTGLRRYEVVYTFPLDKGDMRFTYRVQSPSDTEAIRTTTLALVESNPHVNIEDLTDVQVRVVD